MTGPARGSWQNMSQCSLSKIFSNSANVKDTVGQSPNMVQKFQQQKGKTAIWQEQKDLSSGVVSIHMTFCGTLRFG